MLHLLVAGYTYPRSFRPALNLILFSSLDVNCLQQKNNVISPIPPLIRDYIMAKVVSSQISARPSCHLQRVMRSSCDTRPMTRGRIRLGRADVRDDATLAMVLSFYLIPT